MTSIKAAWRVVGSVMVAVAVTACSSTPAVSPEKSNESVENSPTPPKKKIDAPAPAPKFSGFLKDYSNLKPSPRHPHTLYEQSDKLSSYTAFIVDPVLFMPKTTTRGTSIDAETARDLSADLRKEVTQTLSLNYRVVTERGPGVARIRSAITEIARSQRSGTDKPVKIGGAAVEAEIVDSVTGERLGAVVESDMVDDQFVDESPDPYHDARLIFRHWSARLNLWLQSSHELSTH